MKQCVGCGKPVNLTTPLGYCEECTTYMLYLAENERQVILTLMETAKLYPKEVPKGKPENRMRQLLLRARRK